MTRFFSILFLLFLTANLSEAVNVYDEYGRRTGSFRESSTGFSKYDQYGRRVRTYR
ncbi:hypothetical protein IKA92_07025 [bacterium]|nr:hypothetical protein [bacterium]